MRTRSERVKSLLNEKDKLMQKVVSFSDRIKYIKKKLDLLSCSYHKDFSCTDKILYVLSTRKWRTNEQVLNSICNLDEIDSEKEYRNMKALVYESMKNLVKYGKVQRKKNGSGRKSLYKII